MSFLSKAQLCFFLPFVLHTGKSSPTCSLDQFACVNGPKCIPINWLCDGARDCPDGSDETHTKCHPHLTNITCLGNQPDCLHGGMPRCIPNEWLCDGHWDCDRGEDEAGCDGSHKKSDDGCGPSQHRCGESCISRAQKCEEVRDCKDEAGDDAGLCGHLNSSKTKAKASPPKSDVHQINKNTIHQEAAAINSSTILLPKLTFPLVERKEERASTAAPETPAKNRTVFPITAVNEQTTTLPSASPISLMKFLNYSFVTPSPKKDITQPSSPAPKMVSSGSDNYGWTKLAKVFRTNFSTTEEPPEIRRLPEKNVVGGFKREVSMQRLNETGPEEVVYDLAEEKSGAGHDSADVLQGPGHEGANAIQGKPQAAQEPIQPELQPVKSVVGEPIRPVNL
ncbi:hypothetical protein Y032_0036g3222 [Ancylostoma ceylanicum]|uniref:Low-density lipoprotein receptor domain class A n=1 Tax=Ancylostoma ceylanicum TaxID=53326 RepID=A0A016UK81_9BILA|nr:hypothetical protein Y032_0036g3222 [Ancylostoma ceylanicum]